MTEVFPINDASEPFCEAFTRPQRTLRKAAQFRGRSLFYGHDATVQCLPAEENTGIVFRRTDLPGEPDIPALFSHVARVPRRTALKSSAAAVVETVEHLMAALAGLQIDNCLVEINAPEVPSYDGSCRDFCDGFLQAGIVEQTALVNSLRISGTVSVSNLDRSQTLSLEPHLKPCLAVTYEINYGPEAAVLPQAFSAEITPEYFYEHISAARTFVLESEIAALKQMGYGLHLTTNDIVVVGQNGIINNHLRWPDEAARHKLLDCVGDLALSGVSIYGHVTANRSGHHLNHDLARTVASMHSENVSVSRAA